MCHERKVLAGSLVAIGFGAQHWHTSKAPNLDGHSSHLHNKLQQNSIRTTQPDLQRPCIRYSDCCEVTDAAHWSSLPCKLAGDLVT
jgi:hypothetical protein